VRPAPGRYVPECAPDAWAISVPIRPRDGEHRLFIPFIFADPALFSLLVRPHHGINGGAKETP